MRFLYGPFVGGRAAFGLLIFRLVFGWGIALHGYSKYLDGPTRWGIGLGIPTALQPLAMLAEALGGLAMMLGLLTPLAAVALIVTMLVAIIKAHLPAHEPYVNLQNGPSYELAAHYLTFALCLLLTGPGTLSLDALLLRRRLSDNPYAP